MRSSILAAPPTASGRAPRSTLFDPKRETGDIESRPYTTFTQDGWRDDIKGRALAVYVCVSRAANNLQNAGHVVDPTSHLSTLLCEACVAHGPTTDEEAVELLAATPLRDTIALVPKLRRSLVKNASGATAHINWIVAAQVALCAEFFRLRHVMNEESEPGDLTPFARAGAAQWEDYLRRSAA